MAAAEKPEGTVTRNLVVTMTVPASKANDAEAGIQHLTSWVKESGIEVVKQYAAMLPIDSNVVRQAEAEVRSLTEPKKKEVSAKK